jgi:MIP family channel proteins
VYLAEYFGTCLLLLGINGTQAQAVVSSTRSDASLGTNLATALTVILAVYITSPISGGHLNPAVTISLAFFQSSIAWKKVPGYIIAQFLGAFTGAAIVYGLYVEGLNNVDGGQRRVTGTNATAGIFATYPQPYESRVGACFDVYTSSVFLMMLICAFLDRFNAKSSNQAIPFMVGMAVLFIGLCFGWTTGYPLNPARDFAPRAFSAIFYGSEVFSAYHYYFWIPIVMPVLGCVSGVAIYKAFIGFYLEAEYSKEEISDDMSLPKTVV